MTRNAFVRKAFLGATTVAVVALGATTYLRGQQSARATDFTSLVTVTVRGTSVSVVPHNVEIISAAPAPDVRRAISRGARLLRPDGTSVLYEGVEYRFSAPAEWAGTLSTAPRVGDVLYSFRIEDSSA